MKQKKSFFDSKNGELSRELHAFSNRARTRFFDDSTPDRDGANRWHQPIKPQACYLPQPSRKTGFSPNKWPWVGHRSIKPIQPYSRFGNFFRQAVSKKRPIKLIGTNQHTNSCIARGSPSGKPSKSKKVEARGVEPLLRHEDARGCPIYRTCSCDPNISNSTDDRTLVLT